MESNRSNSKKRRLENLESSGEEWPTESNPNEPNSNPGENHQRPREDYISWKDYFMALAVLSAKRSKDPKRQVGACIVNQNNVIVSLGYNGMPRGCPDNDFPWGNKGTSYLDNKNFYVCHAEMKAIVNENSSNIRGCDMYTTMFPCNECAKIIIQSGIKKIFFLTDPKAHKDQYLASKKMLKAAEVIFKRFIPNTNNRIYIDFEE